jgi:hypothetical protein
MVPGSRYRIPPKLLSAGVIISLTVAIAVLFQFQHERNFWANGWACLRAGIPIGILAAVPFWLLLRRGAVLSPGVTGAAIGLLAGLVGTTVLEIHCPNLDGWHILVSHLGRERIILAAVAKALKDDANAHSLTFGFRTREGGGTSHHLVYASKNVRAQNQMKRIYTKASSDKSDGVGSLDYDPRDAEPGTLSLFSPLEEVRQRLLERFVGRILTFDELILTEADTRFTDTAYRNALLELEEDGTLTMNPPAEQRRLRPGGERRSLPGTTSITFPR